MRAGGCMRMTQVHEARFDEGYYSVNDSRSAGTRMGPL